MTKAAEILLLTAVLVNPAANSILFEANGGDNLHAYQWWNWSFALTASYAFRSFLLPASFLQDSFCPFPH
jgi:hypothetical protein